MPQPLIVVLISIIPLWGILVYQHYCGCFKENKSNLPRCGCGGCTNNNTTLWLHRATLRYLIVKYYCGFSKVKNLNSPFSHLFKLRYEASVGWSVCLWKKNVCLWKKNLPKLNGRRLVRTCFS